MPIIKKSGNYKGFLLSVGISVLIYALCLILSCVAAYATDDPASRVKALSLVALFSSSFISGIFSSRINDGSLLNSLYTGLFMTVLLALISVSLFTRETGFLKSLLLHSVIPIVTLLGALIGKKRNNKYVHRRNRARAHR